MTNDVIYLIEWPPSGIVVFKQRHFIYLHNFKIFPNLLYTMVFTRAQLDTLSRKELPEELIKCLNIADQIKTLIDQLIDFVGKYEKLQSELVISKNCNSLLVNRIINPERNTLSNAQYIRREILEINPVRHAMNNVDLEEKVCEALPLTGTKVKPDDVDVCHIMKKKDKVIIKFLKRKHKNDVFSNEKN